MNDNFFDAVREYGMIKHGDRICVAVSGGADSMCLLHLLYKNRELLGITVSAAHVNHCIRGEESDADEHYVSEFCDKFGIPLTVARIDIPSCAAAEGIGTELCARNKRYEFFASLDCDKIATAHTGSDCIETMLMNLSRGATLRGLSSIPPVRGNIIRPLIFFTRDETEEYCRIHNIKYVTDSTNLTDDYTRNKFRHSVLGLLKNINVSFEQNALRCLKTLREDENYLSAQTEKLFSVAFDERNLTLKSSDIKNADPALAKRVLTYYFSNILGSDCEFKHINSFFESLGNGAVVTLPSGIIVIEKDGKIGGMKPEKYIVEKSDFPEFSPSDGFSGRFGRYSVLVSPSDICPQPTADTVVLDYDTVCGNVVIRTREPGDEITLAGRHCTKKLKKIFTENKVPVSERSFIPVFADENGIIYVPSCGISYRNSKTSKTKKYLIIKTERDKNDE